MEVTILLIVAFLQVAQLVAMGAYRHSQFPLEQNMGPRDEPYKISGVAGRLDRAYQNHFESLILFAIAVLTLEQSTLATQILAIMYLVFRILYVFAYAVGSRMRTLIWAIAYLSVVFLLGISLFSRL